MFGKAGRLHARVCMHTAAYQGQRSIRGENQQMCGMEINDPCSGVQTCNDQRFYSLTKPSFDDFSTSLLLLLLFPNLCSWPCNQLLL